MKLRNMLFAATALLVATSCSHIDEDERLIYVQPVEVSRNVIVEDFTGQRCINCPKATDEIAKYQEEFGENTIIAVGIHCGPYGHQTGSISSRRYPLCTETGDNYFVKWTGKWETPQPCVILNRNKNMLAGPEQTPYGVEFTKELSKTTPVTLELNLLYDESTKEVTANVEAKTSLSVDTKLQIFVLEDSITGTQYMPDGSINAKYVHNHVFRASETNDIYGDVFNIAEGDAPTTAEYKFKLDEKWVAKNVSIVAFVYNDNDGVIQAIKKHLIEK